MKSYRICFRSPVHNDSLYRGLQTLEDSPDQPSIINSDPSSSDYNEFPLDDISDMDSWSEDDLEVCGFHLQDIFWRTLICFGHLHGKYNLLDNVQFSCVSTIDFICHIH